MKHLHTLTNDELMAAVKDWVQKSNTAEQTLVLALCDRLEQGDRGANANRFRSVDGPITRPTDEAAMLSWKKACADCEAAAREWFEAVQDTRQKRLRYDRAILDLERLAHRRGVGE